MHEEKKTKKARFKRSSLIFKGIQSCLLRVVTYDTCAISEEATAPNDTTSKVTLSSLTVFHAITYRSEQSLIKIMK